MKKDFGYYFNPDTWTISLDKPTGDYVKIHPVVMLGLAPLLGALFVVFLPVIGFVMLGSAVYSKLKVKGTVNELLHGSPKS